jgi:hypothetical protein
VLWKGKFRYSGRVSSGALEGKVQVLWKGTFRYSGRVSSGALEG